MATTAMAAMARGWPWLLRWQRGCSPGEGAEGIAGGVVALGESIAQGYALEHHRVYATLGFHPGDSKLAARPSQGGLGTPDASYRQFQVL